MLCYLSRSISPKLVFPQSQTWHYLRFMSTTSALRSKGNSFTVSYLIDACGFSPQRAASVSKHVNFETADKPDLVIEFFKNHGFSQTQMLTVIGCFPHYLLSDPEKTFKPKIEFFMSKGFLKSDIPLTITRCPTILCRSLEKQIIPCFDFFNSMFQSKDKLMKAIKRYSGILFAHDKALEPNIKLLREGGVPESHVVRFVELFPRTLQNAPPKRFKEIVEEVKEMEFDPLRLQFIVAIHVKTCIGRSTWTRREGIYRKWGWTDDDISAAFRVHPYCMSVSNDKIEAAMDFLVNRLGCKSSAIARHSQVVSYSLERRILPRGSVIVALLAKGLVGKVCLYAFGCAERVFLNRYVFRHGKEADALLKLYQAKLTHAGYNNNIHNVGPCP